MPVLVSFIHEKNGEQIETVHQTQLSDFTRDDLLGKFIAFMESLGYVFPKEEEAPPVRTAETPNFDLE